MLLATAACASFTTQAIEPTPPIVFSPTAFDGKGIGIAIKPHEVGNIQIVSTVYKLGTVVNRDKIDIKSLKAYEMEHFPVPVEKFHLEQQKRIAALDKSQLKGDQTQRLLTTTQAAKIDVAKVKLRPDLSKRIAMSDQAKNKLIGILSAKTLDPSRLQAVERKEKSVMFMLPFEREALMSQKDGLYAVDYQIKADYRNADLGKGFTARRWQRFQLNRGRIKPIGIKEYSRLTDPLKRAQNKKESNELVYTGITIKERLPIEKTKKNKALMIELESGLERPDTVRDGKRDGKGKEKTEASSFEDESNED